MSNTALLPVDFHGTSLYAAAIDGVPHVAIKPICDALTVNWPGQYLRIQRHPVLSKGVVVMQIPSAGGTQETICLPLNLLNGWLFGISAARVRDAGRRERLIEYQRECFDALARHFGAAQPNASYARITPEQQDQLTKAIRSVVAAKWLENDPGNKIHNHIRVAFRVARTEDLPAECFGAALALVRSKEQAVEQASEFLADFRGWFARECLAGGTPWTPAIQRNLTKQRGQRIQLPPRVDWLALSLQDKQAIGAALLEPCDPGERI